MSKVKTDNDMYQNLPRNYIPEIDPAASNVRYNSDTSLLSGIASTIVRQCIVKTDVEIRRNKKGTSSKPKKKRIQKEKKPQGRKRKYLTAEAQKVARKRNTWFYNRRKMIAREMEKSELKKSRDMVKELDKEKNNISDKINNNRVCNFNRQFYQNLGNSMNAGIRENADICICMMLDVIVCPSLIKFNELPTFCPDLYPTNNANNENDKVLEDYLDDIDDIYSEYYKICPHNVIPLINYYHGRILCTDLIKICLCYQTNKCPSFVTISNE